MNPGQTLQRSAGEQNSDDGRDDQWRMRNTFVSVAMLAAVLMRDFEIHGCSMRTQTDQVRRTVRTMIAVICLSRAAVIDRLRPI